MDNETYEAPKLESYGSIHNLTGALGPSTIEDYDARSPEVNTTGSYDVVPRGSH